MYLVYPILEEGNFMDIRLIKVSVLGAILLACVFAFYEFTPSVMSENNNIIEVSTSCEVKEESRTDGLTEVSQSEISSQQETESYSTSQSSNEYDMPAKYLIQNFEVVLQMPELPTGCEITAMTMVLNYYGYQADKMEMALEYLPTVSADLYYGEDGQLYGPDLNQYFVGDPCTSGGYICGPEAIITAANDYLADEGSSFQAVDLTGTSPTELYQLVREDTPIVVWITISMQPRRTPQGWYTEGNEYVDWSTNDHGAVLIGYSESTVTIADPIAGIVEYNRDAFEKVFASRGYQCVALQ